MPLTDRCPYCKLPASHHCGLSACLWGVCRQRTLHPFPKTVVFHRGDITRYFFDGGARA